MRKNIFVGVLILLTIPIFCEKIHIEDGYYYYLKNVDLEGTLYDFVIESDKTKIMSAIQSYFKDYDFSDYKAAGPLQKSQNLRPRVKEFMELYDNAEACATIEQNRLYPPVIVIVKVGNNYYYQFYTWWGLPIQR